jgi:hypothetical protein
LIASANFDGEIVIYSKGFLAGLSEEWQFRWNPQIPEEQYCKRSSGTRPWSLARRQSNAPITGMAFETDDIWLSRRPP